MPLSFSLCFFIKFVCHLMVIDVTISYKCSIVKVMSEYSVQQKTFKFPVGNGSPGYKDQHMYLTLKGLLFCQNQTSMKVYNQLKQHFIIIIITENIIHKSRGVHGSKPVQSDINNLRNCLRLKHSHWLHTIALLAVKLSRSHFRHKRLILLLCITMGNFTAARMQ